MAFTVVTITQDYDLAYYHHDFADETRRIGTFQPCVRASSPAVVSVASLAHGSANAPAGNSS